MTVKKGNASVRGASVKMSRRKFMGTAASVAAATKHGSYPMPPVGQPTLSETPQTQKNANRIVMYVDIYMHRALSQSLINMKNMKHF